MRAWRCQGLLVAAALAVVGGCGESSHEGDDPGTGGGSAASGGASGSAGQAPNVGGGAGSTGGSAGSGAVGAGGALAGGGGSGVGGSSAAGGAPDQATAEYRACAAYVEARCQRLDECGSYSAGSCMDETLPLCPDWVFGPGTNNTPELIQECAVAWQTASCTVLQTFIPVCVYAPGQYEDGATCTTDPQCQSGRCSGSSDSCGQCQPVLAPGDACSAGFSACPAGYTCTGNVCAPRRPTALPAGTACDIAFVTCQSGSVCRADDTGEATCQSPLDAGAACVGNAAAECRAYHYCEPATLVCTPSPPAGMPCGESGIGACDSESFCDRSATPPVCVPQVGLGGTCFDDPDLTDVHGNCQGGFFCVCAAGEDCTDGICMQRAAEGEACGDATTFCVPGTECRDGTCTVSGLQGFFADACNR